MECDVIDGDWAFRLAESCEPRSLGVHVVVDFCLGDTGDMVDAVEGCGLSIARSTLICSCSLAAQSAGKASRSADDSGDVEEDKYGTEGNALSHGGMAASTVSTPDCSRTDACRRTMMRGACGARSTEPCGSGGFTGLSRCRSFRR